MAILQFLQQLLTTKATAVLAAFALVGGGAAIAAPGTGGEPTGEEPEESTELDEVSLEGLAQQQLQQLVDACAEDPDAEYCSGDSADGDESEGDMAIVEPTEDVDAALEEEGDGEEDPRSETARRVHRALTGSDDMVPGDPGFGEAVSSRARSGQPGELGRLVSRAAQGIGDEDPLELEPRAPRAPTEEPEADELTAPAPVSGAMHHQDRRDHGRGGRPRRRPRGRG